MVKLVAVLAVTLGVMACAPMAHAESLRNAAGEHRDLKNIGTSVTPVVNVTSVSEKKRKRRR
jgi:hypothetical protein